MKALCVKATGAVVETRADTFPVHADLEWRDAAMDVKPGHTWDGTKFVAPVASAPVKRLSVDGLAALLVAKGILTQADVDGAKT